MVGVAVKVTLVLSQIVLSASLLAMLTLGVTLPVTVIVIVLLVAELDVAHVLLEVITTLTRSPSSITEVEKFAVLTPTLTPLILQS